MAAGSCKAGLGLLLETAIPDASLLLAATAATAAISAVGPGFAVRTVHADAASVPSFTLPPLRTFKKVAKVGGSAQHLDHHDRTQPPEMHRPITQLLRGSSTCPQEQEAHGPELKPILSVFHPKAVALVSIKQ